VIKPKNRLEPIELENDGEAALFVRDNVCSECQGHLVLFPAPGRKWQAKCPEHGWIMAHNYMSKADALRRDQQIRSIQMDIRYIQRSQK
jgi:hypothetical protein